MKPPTRRALVLATLTGGLLVGGCVDRTEHLSIERDGRIDWRVEVRGDDASELRDGRVPRADSAWTIRRFTLETDDGKTKHVVDARLRLAPEDVIPSSFALDDERLAPCGVTAAEPGR